MHISHVKIKNFRALGDIECDFGRYINVIVGPNAVGKTTILQAMRLVKAILAPRTQQEPNQVLISLGAASPHFPQRLFLQSLARDINSPVEISCTFTLTRIELGILRESLEEVAQFIVAQQAGQGFSNPAQIVQFMQSPPGLLMRNQATIAVKEVFSKLEQDSILTLGLKLGDRAGIEAVDPIAGSLLSFLDQRLSPSTSLFSYFPADRALPMGEVNLQLGGPDMQQQLESHNSQPQLKYMRLKNIIINSFILDQQQGKTLQNEFELIFSGILRGRKIHSVSVNELGLLSVMTEEISSGRLIELDSLSSGEKNVVLTFLLVSRSVHEGGVVLFDEPELHLNPSVCRDVIGFMDKEYSQRNDIQFLMCTHSPDILASAFSNSNCTLLHLKTSEEISRVGKRALDEYSDALQRLGTSVTESLLYDGTILVEGDDDVDFLQTGFPDIVKRYKVSAVGGRNGIEQAIKDLQGIEASGKSVSPIFLIFDKDESPSNLRSTHNIKVLQWPKRCIENYMIDIDVITELLKDGDVTNSPITSESEVHKRIRALAFSQLDAIAARDVYRGFKYENPTFIKEDLASGDLEKIAEALFDRLQRAIDSMSTLPRSEWRAEFIKVSRERKNNLERLWDAKWKDICDGKKLISDLHKASNLRVPESNFRRRITALMRDSMSENWLLVKDLLDNFLN